MKKAITFDGPEFQALADKAREYKLYIAGGGIVEKVPQFPDRWFNSAFIIGPKGDLVLRYHKWHIPASIGLGTSPHDLLDEYREVFGTDIKTLFPVIDTEIGKLGTMTCHDGCTPEVSRALGYNGCEVICHPVALQEAEGVSPPWDFWMFTRRTRAHDNMAYVLGSNWGTVDYAYYPKAFCPGNSFAIDYTGMVMRHAPYPQEQVLAATIDIEALREHRSRCNHNCWVDVRTEGFRQIYDKPIYPANQFPTGKPPRTLADKMGPRERGIPRSVRPRAVHAAGRQERSTTWPKLHARARAQRARIAARSSAAGAKETAMKVESPLANMDMGIGSARRVGNDLVLTSLAGGSVETVITVSAGEVLRTIGTVLSSPSGLGFVLGLPFFWLRQRLGKGPDAARRAGGGRPGQASNINKPW